MSKPFFKAGLVALAGAAALLAQESKTVSTDAVPTLHVYTNLVQLPTLVLWGNRQPMETLIDSKRFSVSVDSGPWFRVSHARLEGNDPISLSILLDTAAEDFMTKMGDALASLTPSYLTPKDHISIYALDCGLTRSLNDAAVDRRILRPGVEGALKPWMTRREEHHSCGQSVHLWDTLAFMVTQLAEVPGRRVIILVTDGRDRGSKHIWNEVRAYAQVKGVAVFAVTPVPLVASSMTVPMRYGATDAAALLAICELSGGMVTNTYSGLVNHALQEILTMVRGRYILEFPRPSNATEGAHDLRIKVTHGEDLFVRPSGITVPLPDPSVTKDPTTVQVGPAEAPEQGHRRILDHPK
jgi:hypothetical protein